MDKLGALKRYFGHGAFRPGQEELVDALLAGGDALGVMPTGAGKSVCYQLPALLLPGTALVISPLISLMKDQVAALTQAGVSAAFLNSTLSQWEYRQVLDRAAGGGYRLLYAAPERLDAPGFVRFARGLRLSLVAVDEAHCISQWGQDFRPSYLKIAQFLDGLPRRPGVGAFTATATGQVREDIHRLLRLRDPRRVTTGFDRPNLFLRVVRPKSKAAYLRGFLRRREGQCGIVYCSTRKTVEAVWEGLLSEGVAAARYHAGLTDEERRRSQEDFVFDRARVMVATNAFGMGIDKSNVNFVVHYNMPKDVESYYQEAGRAGRDGSPAQCTLLFSQQDVRTARFLIDNGEENPQLTREEREELRRRELERLEKMVAYCRTTGCLRGYLLRYFGENAPERCGACGSCTGELESRDITVEAQKILSAVTRVERRYPSSLGTALIVRLLQGGRDKRLLQLGLDALPTYGAMADIRRGQIREYVDWLVEQDYLYADGTDYPVLRTTPRAKEVLFRGERVTYTCQKRSRAELAEGRDAPPQGEADGTLLEVLRAVRTRLAAQEGVPAYVVFSNASLADMAARQPGNMEQFHGVSGVGAVKARRYGAVFLEAIARWRREREGARPE